MTVHIDELHSEVAPLTTGAGESTQARRPPPWEAEQRWCEERARSNWLAGRVAAVDFDD